MQADKLTILVVDDDVQFLEGVVKSMSGAFDIRPVSSLKEAKEKIEQYTFDLVLLDLVYGNENNRDGFKLLEHLKKEKPDLPVIIMSKHDNDQNFEEAIKRGAAHFFRKYSINYTQWARKIEEAANIADLASKENNANSTRTSDRPTKADTKIAPLVSKEKPPIEGRKVSTAGQKVSATEPKEHTFIGNTPKVLEIKQELAVLAQEPDVTVLLLGETGVGKEVAARYLHRQGARKDKPFVAVNMKGIAETLLESTLFGHKKGAFTDAIADSTGALGEADSGVIFLDEIGEISLDLQAKLLRFLQEKEIRPVGGKGRHVDVQIVAATNKDLKEEVEKGNFREDFYHRLNYFPITIPPLRERREDIPSLIKHYLLKKGKTPDIFDVAVREKFLAYHWPGNIRELTIIINRLLLKKKIAKKDIIDVSLLPEEMRYPSKTSPAVTNVVSNIRDAGNEKEDIHTSTARKELERIEEALIRLKKKKLVVAELGFKNLDQLRNRINSHYKKHKEKGLFKNFPVICKKYKLH